MEGKNKGRRLSDRDLCRMEGKPVFVKDINAWMLVCLIAGRPYLRAGDGSMTSPEDHAVYPFEREAAG